jgi:hypothetical protein
MLTDLIGIRLPLSSVSLLACQYPPSPLLR